MQTPWGKSDYSKKIANGIMLYGTPSHGGYHLSETRLQELHPALLKTFAGRGWYEEDCDWALVRFAYPAYFENQDYVIPTMDDAMQTIKTYKPELYAMIQSGEVKPVFQFNV